jgi:hypothetical protein
LSDFGRIRQRSVSQEAKDACTPDHIWKRQAAYALCHHENSF